MPGDLTEGRGGVEEMAAHVGQIHGRGLAQQGLVQVVADVCAFAEDVRADLTALGLSAPGPRLGAAAPADVSPGSGDRRLLGQTSRLPLGGPSLRPLRPAVA